MKAREGDGVGTDRRTEEKEDEARGNAEEDRETVGIWERNRVGVRKGGQKVRRKEKGIGGWGGEQGLNSTSPWESETKGQSLIE